MNPLLLIALCVVLVLIFWDWMVKRSRTSRKPETSDEDFLVACRGPNETGLDAIIIDKRRVIAKELGLPTEKLSPDDNLLMLRDRYCTVVSGHLALGDLLEDLEHNSPESAALKPQAEPDTVREYIDAALERSEELENND